MIVRLASTPTPQPSNTEYDVSTVPQNPPSGTNDTEPETASTENEPPAAPRTRTEPASNKPPDAATSLASTSTRTALPNDVDIASATAHGTTPGYTTNGRPGRAVWAPPLGFTPEASIPNERGAASADTSGTAGTVHITLILPSASAVVASNAGAATAAASSDPARVAKVTVAPAAKPPAVRATCSPGDTNAAPHPDAELARR